MATYGIILCVSDYITSEMLLLLRGFSYFLWWVLTANLFFTCLIKGKRECFAGDYSQGEWRMHKYHSNAHRLQGEMFSKKI